MESKRCPHCNSEAYDGSECYECMFLACPKCGNIVNDFGEIGEVNPCEHVVAWGTIGENEVFWKNKEFEQKFNNFCEEKEGDEEETGLMYIDDIVREYADKHGLDFIIHSDEAGHGASRAIFLVFRS